MTTPPVPPARIVHTRPHEVGHPTTFQSSLSTRSQPHLLDLPSHLLANITARCDRTIIATVCKAFHATYPPLTPTTLRPDGPLTAPALLPAAAALLQRHAPSLTALDLRHVGHLLTSPTLQTLLTTPNLASLTLRNHAPAADYSILGPLTARPLTHLEITSCGDGVDTAFLLTVCARLTTLRSLTLQLDSSTVAHAGAGNPFVTLVSNLQLLSSLHLTADFSAPLDDDEGYLHAGYFVLHTTSKLPALRSLTLDGDFTIFHGPMQQLLPQHTQLTRLSCHIDVRMPEHGHEDLTDDDICVMCQPALQAITSLTRLQVMHLEGVYAYPDAVGAMLAGLPALRRLELTAVILPPLQPLVTFQGSGLTALRLERDDFPFGRSYTYQGQDLQPLVQLAGTLKVLSLRQGDISLPCLRVVSQLTALTELELCSMGEPDEERAHTWPRLVPEGQPAAVGGPAPALGGLQCLQVLHLGHGAGTWAAGTADAAARQLAPLTNLTCLTLAWCGLTGEVLTGGGWLAGLRQLRCLHVPGNSSLWPGLQQGVGSLPPLLQELHLPMPKGLLPSMAQLVGCLVPPPRALRRLGVCQSVQDEEHDLEPVCQLLAPYGVHVLRLAVPL